MRDRILSWRVFRRAPAALVVVPRALAAVATGRRAPATLAAVLAGALLVGAGGAAGCAGQAEGPPRVAGAEGQGPAELAPRGPGASSASPENNVASPGPGSTVAGGPGGTGPGAAGPGASAVPLAAGWQEVGGELKGKLFESTLHDWNRRSQCLDYDYFPDGGIQNFWCHRPASLTLEKVRELAGVAIFSSGPHSAGGLVLTSPQSFGHYNPAFVRWLVDHASPSPNGSPAQKVSREAYNEFMHPLAEVMWKTYRKAKQEETCFARERSLYSAALARKALPRGYAERWYYFMNPDFCRSSTAFSGAVISIRGGDGGVNGNVTKTAVGFWIRRSLDGTMDTFAEGLKNLIEANEPALLTAP